MSTTEPHAPSGACQYDHCAYHNVDEPVPASGEAPGAQICIECWHYYPSGEALVAEYLRVRDEITEARPEWADVPPPRSAEEIYFCPLCSHDF